MMQTRATRVDGGWEITGRKWFATGAEGKQIAKSLGFVPAE